MSKTDKTSNNKIVIEPTGSKLDRIGALGTIASMTSSSGGNQGDKKNDRDNGRRNRT